MNLYIGHQNIYVIDEDSELEKGPEMLYQWPIVTFRIREKHDQVVS